MKFHLPSIIVVCLATLCACSRPSEDRLTETSPVKSDNISNQFVYDIAEDSTGQIWIGTFRGLNRYNSREFYQYFEGEDSLSLPNNQVRDILVARDGRVYVATVAGVSLHTDRDNFRNLPLGEKYMVLGLAEMTDSTVIALTTNGLLAYHPGSDTTERLADNACPGSIYNMKLHVTDRDELWVVGENSLRRYDMASRQPADSVPTGFFVSNSSLVNGGELWARRIHAQALRHT